MQSLDDGQRVSEILLLLFELGPPLDHLGALSSYGLHVVVVHIGEADDVEHVAHAFHKVALDYLDYDVSGVDFY